MMICLWCSWMICDRERLCNLCWWGHGVEMGEVSIANSSYLSGIAWYTSVLFELLHKHAFQISVCLTFATYARLGILIITRAMELITLLCVGSCKRFTLKWRFLSYCKVITQWAYRIGCCRWHDLNFGLAKTSQWWSPSAFILTRKPCVNWMENNRKTLQMWNNIV
jgi:hypothetical protein